MIELRLEGEVAVLELARGSANPLNQEFLRALRCSLEELREGLPRGLVLTANGKIFCAGLDLLELADASREDLEGLLEELYLTLREVFSFPRPVVAAINGHALAGGALLTLACDRRVMAMGEGRWGLTESRLGLVVPASSIELARYALPRPVLEKVLYGGQAYPAFKAREMGVLDDLAEVDALLPRALEMVEAWSGVPEAFAEIKTRLREPALSAMDRARDRDDRFLGSWYGGEARSRIAAEVARLRNKG